MQNWQNKDWLINQYITLERSVFWIANLVKVHPDIIRFYLDQHKIYRPTPRCQHGMIICEKCNKGKNEK
jgi:hypothetical protein